MREQVFDVWMGYRKCYPKMKLIAQSIEQNTIPTEFVFGKYDVVIPWKHGDKLRALTSQMNYVKWKVVDKGHRLMQPRKQGTHVPSAKPTTIKLTTT